MTLQGSAETGWQPDPLGRLAKKGRHQARDLYTSLCEVIARASGRTSVVDRQRIEFADLLASLGPGDRPARYRRVLVDASWYNANYWMRYAPLRAALGLVQAEEFAVLGPYKREQTRSILSRLGISRVLDFEQHFPPRGQAREQATNLLRSVAKPSDILDWTLPSNLPPAIVYDGILKRQRSAFAQLDDPILVDIVEEALGSIAAAEAVLDSAEPDALFVSHAIEFRYGSLAWCALRRGIPVTVVRGVYGGARYKRLATTADFFSVVDRPHRRDLLEMPAAQRERLAEKGRAYIQKRYEGGTDDIGARYAFGRAAAGISRKDMCQVLAWDPAKPLVAIYASNWFDYPHTYGMSNFSDFFDWLQVTITAASSQTWANWLFRPHPIDKWYGGLTLSDLMQDRPGSHVRLSPESWHGVDVNRAADGIVTMHGTAGLEYATVGKPVLLADKGWYHDIGFARLSNSRHEYQENLASRSWLDASPDRTLAAAFAGIYFCPPSETSIRLGDDSLQDCALPNLTDQLRRRTKEICSEIADIEEWWNSGSSNFHTWRVLHGGANAGRP